MRCIGKMCIRDSLHPFAYHKEEKHLPAGRTPGIEYGNVGPYCRQSGQPVSYTHLDVYKRQIATLSPKTAVNAAIACGVKEISGTRTIA